MNRETTDEIGRWFQAKIQELWPVAEGSLSLRKCPCIRKNCPACAAGEGHRSYVLYGRRKSRRFSLYVPEDLVPAVRKAIENGVQLQEIVNEAGVRFVTALKKQRKAKSRQK